MSLSITPHQIDLVTYCLEQQWAEFTPEEVRDAEQVRQLPRPLHSFSKYQP